MIKIILLGLLSLNAMAVPEGKLKMDWDSTIRPFFESTPKMSFENHQGLKLAYRSFTDVTHKKSIVLLPGRTEPALKYAELIYDLYTMGFDIHILDHQGQGDSERLLSDSHKGHVGQFNDYVMDFTQWMDLLPQNEGKDFYLLAHSMGGAVAVKFLAQSAHSFKKAILNAPMMELNTKPYSEKMARVIAAGLVKIGRGRSYAPGRGPYRPTDDQFESNDITSSETRFNISKHIFTTWPHLVLGGPTALWVKESLKVTKNIHKEGTKITIPVLLLQAGLDQVVKLARQNAFCDQAKNCKLVKLQGAQHEILMERDEFRFKALHEIQQFF